MAKRIRKKGILEAQAIGALQRILAHEDEGFATRAITIATLVEYFKTHTINAPEAVAEKTNE